MKFFEDFEAPPIRKPSISPIFLKKLILILSTEPPYKIGGIFFTKNFFQYLSNVIYN